MLTILTVLLLGLVFPILIIADTGIAISTIPTINTNSWSMSVSKNWYRKCFWVNFLYAFSVGIYFHCNRYGNRLLDGVWGDDKYIKIDFYWTVLRLIPNKIRYFLFTWKYFAPFLLYVVVLCIALIEFFSWRTFLKRLHG